MLKFQYYDIKNDSDESRDRLIMSYNWQHGVFKWSMLRSFGLIFIALTLLQGCAGTPPKKEEIKELKLEQPVVAEISSEIRAEFKAAMEFIQAEEYQKGIEILKKISKELPGNAIPEVNLAIVYKKQDKLKLAEESLNLALKIEPENPVANNEYALLYRKTGKFKEARQVYEHILEKYPNFNMAHKNLGILCDLYMKDYECALNHYVIYSNAVQDDKTVKIWIADVQKRLGK